MSQSPLKLRILADADLVDPALLKPSQGTTVKPVAHSPPHFPLLPDPPWRFSVSLGKRSSWALWMTIYFSNGNDVLLSRLTVLDQCALYFKTRC